MVSIVIPTFNRAEWVGRAIASALAQTDERIEVLVMDDCSTAETEAVVRTFNDSRLHYHRHAERVGIVRNHGSGVERATGRFVAFLSDDDAWREDFVANRVAAFERHAHAVVVFSGVQRCNERFETVGKLVPRLPIDVPIPPARLLKVAIRRQFGINSSLYTRAVLRETWQTVEACVGAFDTGLHFQIAIRHPHGAIYMPWNDVFYTVHSGNVSTSDRHFEDGCQMYEVTLRSPMPGWMARRIRHNYAIWYVNRGRQFAHRGQLTDARAMYRTAIRTFPRARAGWSDYLISLVAPGRLRKPW